MVPGFWSTSSRPEKAAMCEDRISSRAIRRVLGGPWRKMLRSRQPMESGSGRERGRVVQAHLGMLLIFMSLGVAHAQTSTAKPPGASEKVHHITELRGEWS